VNLRALLPVLFLVGCAGPADDPLQTHESSWVSDSTFQRMDAVIRGIDYLPFGYVNGGCHGRALYMGMELAAEGLESNMIFVFSNGAALQYPMPSGGWIGWSFHVAPLLMVGPDADHLTPMVLDPALSSAPMTRTGWIAKMGYEPGAANYPTSIMVPGSVYGPDDAEAEVEWANKDIPDFAHLPSFKTSDVQSACNLMYRNIGREPNGGASDKRKRLLARTSALLEALDAREKLERDVVFSPDLCKMP
jgi:hypothetical protein